MMPMRTLTQAVLAAFPGSSVDGVLEGVCSWPGCGRTHNQSTLADRFDVPWCEEHLGDEFLPVLAGGTIGYCAHCNEATCGWLGETPLHDRCRRPWMAGLVDKTKKVGAYARRSR